MLVVRCASTSAVTLSRSRVIIHSQMLQDFERVLSSTATRTCGSFFSNDDLFRKKHPCSHARSRGRNRLRLIAGVSADRTLRSRRRAAAAWRTAVDAFAANAAKAQADAPKPEKIATETPIKHIIYIVGENRSFDNVFGTYQPKHAKEKIWNLLSQGIVNEDGTPGQEFRQGPAISGDNERRPVCPQPAQQERLTRSCLCRRFHPRSLQASVWSSASSMQTASRPRRFLKAIRPCRSRIRSRWQQVVPVRFQRTARIPVSLASHRLPAGPFQQTGPTLPYDAYEGDTIHQLFQMWQQNDCSMKNATAENPTGCLHDHVSVRRHHERHAAGHRRRATAARIWPSST